MGVLTWVQQLSRRCRRTRHLLSPKLVAMMMFWPMVYCLPILYIHTNSHTSACYWCGSPCGGYYCCHPLPYCGYFTNPFVCVCTN